MTEVSAGIIYNKAGEILACRRGEGRRNAHLWEFPGGKREPGEDAAACLQRELLEELSLPVRNVRAVRAAEEGGIRFTFLTAKTDAEPVATEHEAVCFLRPRDLLPLAFCPADAPVARSLALNDPPLRDLFWDFDGTLFDTYPVMTAAFSIACGKLGARVTPAEALRMMKVSLGDALRRTSGAFGFSTHALAEAYRAEEKKTAPRDYPLMPGMEEALRKLHSIGCRHYLVTHRDATALEALDANGLLPLFSAWVTAEDGFPRKPDPASLLHLIRTHGVDPEGACMVGDRPLDIEAAKNAGILGCLLDPDGHFPDTPCDLRAGSAAELPALLCPEPLP